MPRLFTNAHFLRGMRHGLPFMMIAIPFATLFGVVGTEAGLTAIQTIAFSIIVVAGASQFAAVAQMTDAAPIAIVLLTALAVNMRMAMYSAALAPYLRQLGMPRRMLLSYMLVDQSYLLAAIEYEKRGELSPEDRFAYFLGTFLPMGGLWYLASAIGAYTGALIPPEYALDFVMPIAFIALVAPAIRTLAHGAAALTSVVVALALSGLPYGLGLIVAALCALVAGSLTETWQARRRI